MKLAFVADSTLGKLVKYLRLSGFDTLLDGGVPNPHRLLGLAADDRIVLTRSNTVKNALGDDRLIFITEDRASAQMRQVIRTLHLKKEDLRPMTRCAVCNRLLDPISKEGTRGRVPVFVLQQHSYFSECPTCNRVYWPGSHAERWIQQMKFWFESDKVRPR